VQRISRQEERDRLSGPRYTAEYRARDWMNDAHGPCAIRGQPVLRALRVFRLCYLAGA